MDEPVDIHLNSDSVSDRQRHSTSTPSLSEDGGLSSASSVLTADEGVRDSSEVVVTIGEDEAEGESEDNDEEEDEEDDEEEEGPPIPQPAYFYPSDHTQSIPAQTHYPYLHPTDDPAAQRGIPVFTPTMEEFKEFEVYMEKIAAWGHRSGIVKVIPPAEWTSALPSIPTQTLSSVRIKNPIQQNMLGRSGLFRQSTIEKKKSLSVRDWWEKCRAGVYNYPGPKDAELRKRGNPSTTAGPSTSTSASGRGSGKRRKVEGGASVEVEVETLESTPGPSEVSAEVVEQEVAEEKKESSSDRAVSSTPSSVGTDVKPNVTTSVNGESVDPWYETFDPHSDWVPEGTSQADYTEDGCRSLERKFWRELGLGEACWYGADMKGSLFTEETTSWNVAHLPNLLNRLNLKRKLPGVNTPYLYWGMWAAAFAWHVEDMDLYSINYIHFGAPKFWYAIPQKKADTFERHMAGYFPSDARKCDQFLRHKSFAVSPSNLAGQGTRPNILVQKQGEYVITFPRGYHAGFNMGFNCAESINFALDDWIELGRRAKICRCESENVHIDVDAVLEESALREAAAVAREERRLQAEARKESKESKRPPREKRERKQRPPGEQRIRKLKIKVPSIEFKLPARPPKPVFSCILCPDRSSTQLMPVHRSEPVVVPTPPIMSAPVDSMESTQTTMEGTDINTPMLDATNSIAIAPEPIREKAKKPEFAHLACVRSTPELWIADVWDRVREKSVRKVMGIETIGRERWNLKCSTCQDDPIRHKHGTKIQCTKGKCVKAYHVTCAIKDPDVEFKEMEVDEWVASPADEPKTNGVEGAKMDGMDSAESIALSEPAPTVTTPAAPKFQRVTVVHAHMLCPAHNPAVVERKRREAKQTTVDALLRLPYGAPVSIRLGTGTWGSFLLSFDSKAETAVVTNDKGVPFGVKWNQIVYVAPISQLAIGARMVSDTSRPESMLSPRRDGLSLQLHATASLYVDGDVRPETSAGHVSSATKTTTDLLASHDLQQGAQVALTPAMIRMLSGNPLLRAGLREIGLA